MDEPIADAVRAILDGHIVLSRELAMYNHYPAIDILMSISRVMNNIIDKKHNENAKRLKSILATYKKAEDMINIGAYVKGSNPKIDYAIKMIDEINLFLKQNIDEKVSFDESIQQLESLFET